MCSGAAGHGASASDEGEAGLFADGCVLVLRCTEVSGLAGASRSSPALICRWRLLVRKLVYRTFWLRTEGFRRVIFVLFLNSFKQRTWE